MVSRPACNRRWPFVDFGLWATWRALNVLIAGIVIAVLWPIVAVVFWPVYVTAGVAVIVLAFAVVAVAVRRVYRMGV